MNVGYCFRPGAKVLKSQLQIFNICAPLQWRTTARTCRFYCACKTKKSILTCQIWKSCCWEPRRLRLVGCRGVSLVWIQKTSSLAGPHLSQLPALICNPSIPTVVLKDPTKFSRGAFQTLMASCRRQREPEPEFEKISQQESWAVWSEAEGSQMIPTGGTLSEIPQRFSMTTTCVEYQS